MNILHVGILFDFIVLFCRLMLRIAGLIEHNIFFLLISCIPYEYIWIQKKREQNPLSLKWMSFHHRLSRASISYRVFHNHKGAKSKLWVSIMSRLSQAPSSRKTQIPKGIQSSFQHQMKSLSLCLPMTVHMWPKYPNSPYRYWKSSKFCQWNICQWSKKSYPAHLKEVLQYALDCQLISRHLHSST